MDVQLYVYDLSKGLARQMSAAFLGTQIDAVYHTSLVFGGIEYLFGAGVQTCYPGTTHHGKPMEILSMGRTELEIETILDYLDSLKSIYTAESYDLFAHNCNNFTNDFAMFLVGRSIPSHITSLPETVLNTPFGQMLKPQLDSAMREVTQAPVPPYAVPPNRSNGRARLTSNGASTEHSQSLYTAGIVHNVKGLSEMEVLLQSARKTCAVIFFTSATCAPCKICYPAFEELAAEAGNKAVLIKVDLAQAFDIGPKYGVRATPTFMTFLNGEKYSEWSGADPGRLMSDVRMLIQMAHPPHPHTNLKLKTLKQLHHTPVTYSKIPPLDKLIAKLGANGINRNVTDLKDFIQARTDSQETAPTALPALPAISHFIITTLEVAPPEKLFPLIDLLRLALVDPRVSGYFAEEQAHSTILSIFSHIDSLGSKCPYTLRIVTLQLACNLFTSPLFPPHLLSDTKFSKPIIQLVATSLLDTTHVPVRVSATSLAFNIAAFNHIERLTQRNDILPEDAQVELAASLLEAIGREESKDGLKGLVFALGLLAYSCPRDGEVRDLLGAMNAKGLLGGKVELLLEEDRGLGKEVLLVVD